MAVVELPRTGGPACRILRKCHMCFEGSSSRPGSRTGKYQDSPRQFRLTAKDGKRSPPPPLPGVFCAQCQETCGEIPSRETADTRLRRVINPPLVSEPQQNA